MWRAVANANRVPSGHCPLRSSQIGKLGEGRVGGAKCGADVAAVLGAWAFVVALDALLMLLIALLA